MASVDVTFTCGHREAIREGQAPICSTCGERKRRAVHAPPPRFRGTVSGPHATTIDLAPVALPLVPKE